MLLSGRALHTLNRIPSGHIEDMAINNRILSPKPDRRIWVTYKYMQKDQKL